MTISRFWFFVCALSYPRSGFKTFRPSNLPVICIKLAAWKFKTNRRSNQNPLHRLCNLLIHWHFLEHTSLWGLWSAISFGWTQLTNASDGGWTLGHTQLQSEYWDITDHGNIIATNDDECDCDKTRITTVVPHRYWLSRGSFSLRIILTVEPFSEVRNCHREYTLVSGSNWTVLETILGTDDDLWDSQTIRPSSLPRYFDVLTFRYNDDGSGSSAGIDDVWVYGQPDLMLNLRPLTFLGYGKCSTSTWPSMVGNNLSGYHNWSFDVNWTIATVWIQYRWRSESCQTSRINSLSDVQCMAGSLDVQVYISNISSDTLTMPPTACSSALRWSMPPSWMRVSARSTFITTGSALPNCPYLFVMVIQLVQRTLWIIRIQFTGRWVRQSAIRKVETMEDTFWNVGYDFHGNKR